MSFSLPLKHHLKRRELQSPGLLWESRFYLASRIIKNHSAGRERGRLTSKPSGFCFSLADCYLFLSVCESELTLSDRTDHVSSPFADSQISNLGQTRRVRIPDITAHESRVAFPQPSDTLGAFLGCGARHRNTSDRRLCTWVDHNGSADCHGNTFLAVYPFPNRKWNVLGWLRERGDLICSKCFKKKYTYLL